MVYLTNIKWVVLIVSLVQLIQWGYSLLPSILGGKWGDIFACNFRLWVVTLYPYHTLVSGNCE